MKKYIILTFVLAALVFSSCEDDYTPEKTATADLAGEWYVHLLAEDEGQLADIYGIGYFKILTFNTAANTADAIWIDDENVLLPLKIKVEANPENKTFSGTGEELYDGGNVVVSNGLVLNEATISTGGNQTDSIHFNVEFPWDPGVTYTVAGYRRTGFMEDEH